MQYPEFGMWSFPSICFPPPSFPTPFLALVILSYYASSSSSSFLCYHNLPLLHFLLLSVPYSSLIPISLSLPSTNLILPSSFFLRLDLHFSSPSEIQRMAKAHCVSPVSDYPIPKVLPCRCVTLLIGLCPVYIAIYLNLHVFVICHLFSWVANCAAPLDVLERCYVYNVLIIKHVPTCVLTYGTYVHTYI